MTTQTTTVSRSATTPEPARGKRRLSMRPGAWLTWAALIFFAVNLAGVIGTVVLNSFSRRWFDSWLPNGYTSSWYSAAWKEFSLGRVLGVTLEVTLLVVLISLVIGVPAAYALARRDFPGKKAVSVLFVLPILVPPIAYGIPLATMLYKIHLAGTMSGVIAANLVPSIPFVIFTMTPFIEQIDARIEAAARVCGAGSVTVLVRILTPLLLPGMLAAGILVLVRTFGMFELSFLTSGPTSQTLVVTLFSAVNSAGIRSTQSVDAMAVVYTGSVAVLLLIALRFVNPTQLVARSTD